MQGKQYSRTAWMSAAVLAAHQTLDDGKILPDLFLSRLLGPKADASIAAVSTAEGRKLSLRAAARSRFAEDRLAIRFAGGVRQAVILGAGLDTFGLRNPYPQLTVFEVDHPATQAFKLACLQTAGISAPESLRFVPVDFERGSLASKLSAAGFVREEQTFFTWLGTVSFLTSDAISRTLDFVASVPGSEVVIDYPEPLESYPTDAEAERQSFVRRAEGAENLGEPFISYFTPDTIASLLKSHGFTDVEDFGLDEILLRYLDSGAVPEIVGSRIVRATRNCEGGDV